MTAKPIPTGYHSVTPYLSIKGAKEAIEFYKHALGAIELFRLPTPTGEIGHAEILIGDSHIMMSEPCEESPIPSPEALGGSTIGIHLYNDVEVGLPEITIEEPSPVHDCGNLISNVGSAYAILALQACGELAGWPLASINPANLDALDLQSYESKHEPKTKR